MSIAQSKPGSTLESIKSREDLASFVRSLRDDLDAHPNGWENDTLSRFLDAMAAWIEDMPGYYRNRGLAVPERPDWQTIGEILKASTSYE